MATNATDVVLAGYRALTDGERDEVFERLCQLRVADAAEGDSDMARFLRSLSVGPADYRRRFQPRRSAPTFVA